MRNRLVNSQIKLVFHGLILALIYSALPQVSEVAVAQEPQPAAAEAVPGSAQATTYGAVA
jgi:hypothetical protein